MQQSITFIIPAAVNGAPGSVNFPANFKVFSCLTTNGTYSAKGSTASNPTTVDQAGRGFGGPSGVVNNQLILSNATNADISTTVYLGDTNLPQTVIPNTLTATATLATTTIVSQQLLRSVAVAGTAVAFGAGISFITARIVAVKSLTGIVPNVGNVYVGASGAGRNQPIVLTPGDSITISAPALYLFRFQDYFVNADNNGDGVVIIYS